MSDLVTKQALETLLQIECIYSDIFELLECQLSQDLSETENELICIVDRDAPSTSNSLHLDSFVRMLQLAVQCKEHWSHWHKSNQHCLHDSNTCSLLLNTAREAFRCISKAWLSLQSKQKLHKNLMSVLTDSARTRHRQSQSIIDLLFKIFQSSLIIRVCNEITEDDNQIIINTKEHSHCVTVESLCHTDELSSFLRDAKCFLSVENAQPNPSDEYYDVNVTNTPNGWVTAPLVNGAAIFRAPIINSLLDGVSVSVLGNARTFQKISFSAHVALEIGSMSKEQSLSSNPIYVHGHKMIREHLLSQLIWDRLTVNTDHNNDTVTTVPITTIIPVIDSIFAKQTNTRNLSDAEISSLRNRLLQINNEMPFIRRDTLMQEFSMQHSLQQTSRLPQSFMRWICSMIVMLTSDCTGTMRRMYTDHVIQGFVDRTRSPKLLLACRREHPDKPALTVRFTFNHCRALSIDRLTREGNIECVGPLQLKIFKRMSLPKLIEKLKNAHACHYVFVGSSVDQVALMHKSELTLKYPADRYGSLEEVLPELPTSPVPVRSDTIVSRNENRFDNESDSVESANQSQNRRATCWPCSALSPKLTCKMGSLLASWCQCHR